MKNPHKDNDILGEKIKSALEEQKDWWEDKEPYNNEDDYCYRCGEFLEYCVCSKEVKHEDKKLDDKNR